jgi:PAS domain S-box-containing protein
MRGPLVSERDVAATTHPRTCVLVVQDPASEGDGLVTALQSSGDFRVVVAATPQQFEQCLREQALDVVVSELGPWEWTELEVLQRVREAHSQARVVVATAHGSEHWAVEAMKRGAADYLSTVELDPATFAARVAAAGVRLDGAASPTSDSRAADAYHRILNALSVNAAFIDQAGTIRLVNRAWREQNFANPFHSSRYREGMNYLVLCQQAVADGADGAERIASGLQAILSGQRETFASEYPYHEGDRKRWFRILAGAVREGERRGAIVVHVEISDRKRAEEERDRMFEQSLNLFCIIGIDGYMKRWNPAWCGVFGYSYEEMMSLPLAPLVHLDDIPIAVDAGGRLMAGEDVVGVELRIRCKDGSYKWVLWNAVPCLDQKVYFATGQDITVRKQYEDQLRESQERFELIGAATKEAIWDWDLREDRLWRNESYVNRFGPIDTTQSVIEWWRQRIHPDDRQRIMDMMPLNGSGSSGHWTLEYRLRRLDGTYAHVFDRGFVISDTEGKPTRMVGSLMDVSALKTAEAKLRESDERFRLAAKATRDAIWDWDLRKGHVWRSEGFHTLFGYSRDEIQGGFDWWLDRIHEDDRQRIIAQLSPGSAAPRQFSFEYRFRRADGSYADVFDRGFLMLDDEGRPARMIGTIMDISERRRAEELAHMHRAELAHIARVSTMGEIATGLAHELNQPLTAISNYAESCARALAVGPLAGDEKLLGWIERISTNTHRAAEMIRRLRSFTRKSTPKRSTIEISELVDEVIDLIEAETRLQSVRLRWQPQRRDHVTVDRIQVQQVMINLLRNAYEAMSANDASCRIVTIRAVRRDPWLELSVEDNGEGISPPNLDRVFEAFFTSKSEGVGIGLAISRSIVEDHGGRLWVTPNAERGVTFHFTLPLSGENDGAAAHGNSR